MTRPRRKAKSSYLEFQRLYWAQMRAQTRYFCRELRIELVNPTTMTEEFRAEHVWHAATLIMDYRAMAHVAARRYFQVIKRLGCGGDP